MYQILLVDDEASVIKSMMDMVKKSELECSILSASNAEEAMAIIRTTPIHILITDVRMIGMTGLELIVEAKKIRPDLFYIVVSAYDDFEYVKTAISLGVQNYVLKPINSHELIETIKKTIQNIEITADQKEHSLSVAAFRNNILDRWVNSAFQEFELVERARTLNFNLNANNYFVALFCLEKSDEKNPVDNAIDLLNYVNKQIDSVNCYSFIDSYLNVSLIFVDNRPFDCRKKLIELAHRVQTMFSVYCTIGQAVSSPYSLLTSYRQALMLQTYRFIDPLEFPCFAQDFYLKTSALTINETEYEEALTKLDIEAAQAAYLKLIAPHSKKVYEHSIQWILVALHSFNQVKPKVLLQDNRLMYFLANLKNCQNTPNTKQTFCDGIAMIIKAAKKNIDSSNPLVQRAIAIIHHSYGTDLKIKSISDSFNVNPSYFGQLFKSETGEYFTAYLMRYRLYKARDLLIKTDMKINLIPAKIGILQQSYFNRVFKKEFGMSPAEYRKSFRQ